MQLLDELAEILLGELATVVMQSEKMMNALYRTVGLQFLNVDHIHGHFGGELGHVCKSWYMLDEHAHASFLDQEIMPMEMVDSRRVVHIPKSLMMAWILNGRTHDQKTQSIYWQKKINAAALRDKPGPFAMWFDPYMEASFMVDQVG